jgi:hypothetical protein
MSITDNTTMPSGIANLLTTKEVAGMLRLCPQSVRTLCDQKRLACVRHNPNGKRLIFRESVEAYLSMLTDSVESYVPAVVEFDNAEQRLSERIKRLRSGKR